MDSTSSKFFKCSLTVDPETKILSRYTDTPLHPFSRVSMYRWNKDGADAIPNGKRL